MPMLSRKYRGPRKRAPTPEEEKLIGRLALLRIDSKMPEIVEAQFYQDYAGRGAPLHPKSGADLTTGWHLFPRCFFENA